MAVAPKQNFKDHQYTNLGKITYCLLHDINKTLNSMNINLTLMKEKSRYNDDLVSTSLNGINKISNLLASANKQLQNKPFRQYFSPTEEIKDILDLLSYRLQRSGIELDLELASGEIYGDTVKFSQVVMNLLTNAIDAIEESEKNIENQPIKRFGKIGSSDGSGNKIQIISKFEILHNVKSAQSSAQIAQSGAQGGAQIAQSGAQGGAQSASSKSKCRYKLEIADNGVGLRLDSNDDHSIIFNKGYSTKDSYGQNQGLGLYIVKQIVENEFLGNIQVVTQDDSQGAESMQRMTRFRVSFMTNLRI